MKISEEYRRLQSKRAGRRTEGLRAYGKLKYDITITRDMIVPQMPLYARHYMIPMHLAGRTLICQIPFEARSVSFVTSAGKGYESSGFSLKRFRNSLTVVLLQSPQLSAITELRWFTEALDFLNAYSRYNISEF